MTVCAVIGCKSTNDRRRIKNPYNYVEVSFCRFPRDETLHKLWLSKCGRSNIKSKSNALFICLKHFKPEGYVRNLRHELLNYYPKSRKKIKDDAIPSLFLPDSVENNVSPTNVIVSESEDKDVKTKSMSLSEKCSDKEATISDETYVVVIMDPSSEEKEETQTTNEQTSEAPKPPEALETPKTPETTPEIPKTSKAPNSDPPNPIQNMEQLLFEFVDHVVIVYLNRCRSRAGDPNVGMPAYILKGKAKEAAILLGSPLESRFHWIEEFRKKIAESDAKGVVLTKHPESLSIADIIKDEWPKFAEQKGLDIGHTEEKDMQDSQHAGSNQPKEPVSPTTQKKMRIRESQEGFLTHVLTVFINRFKASFPQAVIPNNVLSTKYKEAVTHLGTQIKNRTIWFRKFKLRITKRSLSEIILTTPDQSLDIYEIIEVERLKYKFDEEEEEEPEKIVNIQQNIPTKTVEIESDEETLDAFESIKFESSDAFEGINFENTDAFKQIKAELSDEFEQTNEESSEDVIETYEEARDCLNLVNNYALEIGDLSAFELIMQADLFLGSEDCED